jgi:hypothetical protein
MMRSAKMAVVAVVLACAGVAAADAAWTSVDDAAAKRGSAGAFVVLLAKADDADVAALEKLMDDKKVKATGDPTLFVRIEPGDADTAKKLDLAPKGSEKILVLDGFGGPVDHKDKLMTADQLGKALKTARDATAKKHKIEKKLEAALGKADAALKHDDSKSACAALLAVLEYEKTMPCTPVAEARKKIDELSGKGKALLEQARAELHKSAPKATKMVNDAVERYPTPEVLEEAKKVRAEIDQVIRQQSGK